MCLLRIAHYLLNHCDLPGRPPAHPLTVLYLTPTTTSGSSELMGMCHSVSYLTFQSQWTPWTILSFTHTHLFMIFSDPVSSCFPSFISGCCFCVFSAVCPLPLLVGIAQCSSSRLLFSHYMPL